MPPNETTNGTNGHQTAVSRTPRTKNTLQVLNVLQRRSPITQMELAEDTDLSRGTVSGIVRRLYETQLIESVAPEAGASALKGGGRPPSAIRLRGDAAIALSIDFGLRHVCVARGNLLGIGAHAELDHEIDVAFDAPKAIEAAVPLVEEVMKDTTPRDLVGVCVGLPAPIDQKRQQIASTRGITSWTGVRPADELRYRLGPAWDDVPFILENDANLTALAEFEAGAARLDQDGVQDIAVVVKWSDGIGAAVLIDGETVVGHRGLAVEFGHTAVPLLDGKADLPAPCGRCGQVCLERLAGGRVLTDKLCATGNDTFGDIIRRAAASEGPERQGMRQAAEYVGQALGLYVTVFNPRIVVVCGRHFGLAPDDVAAYRVIADSLRAGMRKTGFPPGLEDVDIALGERASLAAAEGGVIAMMRSRLPRHLESRLS